MPGPTSSPRALRPLLLLGLLGLAWWFFGNLYEAIVISPNWVVETPAQLTRLHEFFQVTSPTGYFVPATQLGLIAVWAALVVGRRVLPRATAIAAATVSLALAALTAVIVVILVRRLFGTDYLTNAETLSAYAWWWNLANLVRMLLTATCGVLVWRLLQEVLRAGSRSSAAAS